MDNSKLLFGTSVVLGSAAAISLFLGVAADLTIIAATIYSVGWVVVEEIRKQRGK